MPNIYDVAKEAGVSRSTVSRVINNQNSVKEEKRQRVLAAIKKLNYTPNETARALATNKTNTIGVVSRELTETFNAEFINAIQEASDELHYGAIYCVRNHRMKSNINYIDFLNKKVDGIIFIGETTIKEEELRSLSKSKIPVVVMEVKYDIEPVTYITVNNKEAVYDSVSHLVSLGHKRIANINPIRKTQEINEREQGYLDGVNSFGLEYNKTYEVHENITRSKELMDRIAEELIKDQVSAAFCFNNVLAIGLAEALINKGVSIPTDFSIVGFDDINYQNLSSLMLPRFTSSLQPQKEMARYAVNTLVEQINRPKGEPIKGMSKEFKCELNVYDSTAKVHDND